MAAINRPAAERSRTRRCGFTMPEVSLAVIVLAMAITTAITAMQRALIDLDAARSLRVAGSILQCELEKERLLDWSRVSDPAYQPALDASFLRDPGVAGRFTLSRAVAPIGEPVGEMVQVTLTVTWRTQDGRSVSRTHTTYFRQGGLHTYIYRNA